MRRLNLLFTLSSLNVLLITIERFSFTTKILLQPFSFLRLHEIVQITLIILFSVIIPFFVIRELSRNFELIKTKPGFYYFLIFFIGIYFYSTGNGLHEVASFTLNQYCDAKNPVGQLCQGLFFNDFYIGNGYYFLGAILAFSAGLLIEKLNPVKPYRGKELAILFFNSFIFSLTFFVYAAFDQVVVGLFSLLILLIITLPIFFSVRKKFRQYPYITYSAFAYTLASVASLAVRLR